MNFDTTQMKKQFTNFTLLNAKLKKGVGIFYMVVILLVILLAFWALVEKQGVRFLLFLPVAGLCFCGCVYGRIILSGRGVRVLWIFLHVLSTMVMIYVAFSLEVDFSWDWGGLIQNASQYVLTGECDLEYYARYPNNSFWLTCLIGVFKVFKFFDPDAVLTDFKAVSIVFSCLLVQFAIFFMYQTAKMIWNERRGFLVGVTALLFAPFYLYAMYAYTDTAGCLAVSIFVWIHIKTKKEQQNSIGWMILWGVMASFVLQIKVMGGIVCIAAFIDRLLTAENFRKWIRDIGVIAVFFCVCLVGLRFLTGVFVPVTDELSDRYKFPPVHWIMMGLNEGGGYSEEDVQYTVSFPTYKERWDADVEKIYERFSDMGVGGTLDLFVRKSKGLWKFGSLGSEFYIRNLPLHADGRIYKLFAYEAEYHHLGTLYMDLFWGCILIGLVLAGFQRKSLISCTGKLGVMGIIFFLCFWESNSRYLFVFMPLFFLTAADGWLMLRDHRIEKKRR